MAKVINQCFRALIGKYVTALHTLWLLSVDSFILKESSVLVRCLGMPMEVWIVSAGSKELIVRVNKKFRLGFG